MEVFSDWPERLEEKWFCDFLVRYSDLNSVKLVARNSIDLILSKRWYARFYFSFSIYFYKNNKIISKTFSFL